MKPCTFGISTRAPATDSNGSPAAIIFIFHNQPQLGFQLGDTVAVWGKPDDGGNLVMQRVYVYDTNTWVRVKK